MITQMNDPKLGEAAVLDLEQTITALETEWLRCIREGPTNAQAESLKDRIRGSVWSRIDRMKHDLVYTPFAAKFPNDCKDGFRWRPEYGKVCEAALSPEMYEPWVQAAFEERFSRQDCTELLESLDTHRRAFYAYRFRSLRALQVYDLSERVEKLWLFLNSWLARQSSAESS